MRPCCLSLLLLVGITLPSQAAQPDISDILGTWSGLDKTTVALQLSSVALTIEAGSDQSIQGTLESTTIPNDANSKAVTTTATIDGKYLSDTGILVFREIKEGVSIGQTKLAVFNEDGTAMAIFHTSNQANQAPYILYRGDEVPASLLSLVDLDPLSAGAQAARKDSAQQQRDLARDTKAQYQQDTKDLNARIAASVRARDTKLTAELRAQMKALRKEYAARPVRGTTRRRDTGACPEHVLAWANELENNGASLLHFYSYVELSNLFRPSVFEPHFGKPFSDFNSTELQELQLAIQGPCSNDGSAIASGGTRIPLGNILSGRAGYGVTEAGIAGLALELIAGWYTRTSEPIFSSTSLQELESFDKEGAPFLRTLWPEERNTAQTRLTTLIEDLREQKVIEQLDSIAAGLKAGDVNALNDLLRLSSIFAHLNLERSRADRQRVRLLEIVYSGIAEHLEVTHRRLQEIADPKERLIAGRDWYVVGAWALQNFAERSPTVTPFWALLGADREEAYREAKPQLLAEIDAIELRRAAVAYGYDFRIDIDDDYSPTWREINEKRVALVNSIDYEAHVIRVGEGPFGPDYPGAILLNAIYRNDLEQIAEEDNRFHEAFIQQTALLADNPLSNLAELLMGGSGTGAETKLWIEREVRKNSMISPILGFFAVAYDRIYPECMDPDAIQFVITTQFETVVTNGWNMQVSSYPSGSSTEYYKINRRHEAVFKKLDGDTNSPESIGFFGNLWGNQVQADMRESLQFLSNSMRGLRKAMHEHGCDSEVMKRLDGNMLHIYNTKYP